MNQTYLKYAAGAGLFLLWLLLDYLKINDADLIWTIKAVMASLLGWHAIANLQLTPQPPVQVAPEPPSAATTRGSSFPIVPLKEGS